MVALLHKKEHIVSDKLSYQERYNNLYKRINEELRTTGITEVSRLTGLPYGTIQKIRNSRIPPKNIHFRAFTIYRLCQELDKLKGTHLTKEFKAIFDNERLLRPKLKQLKTDPNLSSTVLAQYSRRAYTKKKKYRFNVSAMLDILDKALELDKGKRQ